MTTRKVDLIWIIRKQEEEIKELKHQLEVIYRKLDHGCWNFNCKECDT